MSSLVSKQYRSIKWKIYSLGEAIRIWSRQTREAKNRVDLEKLECLPPLDRYVVYSGVLEDRSLFHPSYEGYRLKRINKILEIYGVEHFKDMRILEVGAGHGDIGAFFAELGAEVLCLDGRIQNVNFAKIKHRKVQNISFQQCNLENDFSNFGRFDLIINFGLIYHLKKVEEHLKCCFSMSDEIIMETVVLDSLDPQVIIFCDERQDVTEEALEGVGSRPSPFYIERIAEKNRFKFERHFSSDLNSGDQFSYDWEHRNDGRGAGSKDFTLRRFWRFKKEA